MNWFITGGSRGIGAAIAREAAREGHDVAITFRAEEQAASVVLAELTAIRPGGRYRAFQLDVRDSRAVEEVANRALDELERIDVVVANAGKGGNGLAVSLSDEEWRDVIDTNLSGAFYTCRAFLPAFLGQRAGRFVLISSLSARGTSGQAHYAASKAGLLGLSATLAKEYGRRGITCNVVSPGFFETDMTRAGLSEKNREFWRAYCPLGRIGALEEVARAVTFLAGPGGAFINGQELAVDGGLGWAP